MFEVVCASGRLEFNESKSRSSSGAGRHCCRFGVAVCSQDFEMLLAIRLPTPMLTGYANGLAIPTKGLALSLLSHTRNDIKHLQRNQGFGKHQTHERVNDHAYYEDLLTGLRQRRGPGISDLVGGQPDRLQGCVVAEGLRRHGMHAHAMLTTSYKAPTDNMQL